MNPQEMYNLALANLPTFISHVFHSLVIIAVFALLYKICGAKGALIKMFVKQLKLAENDPIATVCSRILHIFIAVIGFITLAEEWGFNLGAVIASLGVGSLALALAAQDTAKNFFSTFVLLIEKPYTVGDKITTGGLTGIVQEVNFRSTVLKADNGELIYIPNANISNVPLTNFGKK